MNKDSHDIPDIKFNDGQPHVVGSRCSQCGAVQFPKRPRCSACGAGEEHLTTQLFDRRADVESYARIHTPNPKFEPPYTVGYLRLSPGDVRVFAPFFDVSEGEIEIGSSVKIAVGESIEGESIWGATLSESDV